MKDGETGLSRMDRQTEPREEGSRLQLECHCSSQEAPL